MKIGVLKYRFNYYTNLRNILYKLPEAEYIPVKDWYSFVRRVALFSNNRLGKSLFPTFDLNNQFDDFELNKVDVLHFSNGISYGRTPWVSHFETILPRFSGLMNRYHGKEKQTLELSPLIRKGFDALQSSSCKRIIAWSECAAEMERDLLAELPANMRDTILEKLVVIHPPQEVLSEKAPDREYDAENPIRFILVGAAFFRKGGREILQAFESLINEGLPIKLVLVSSLRLEPYAAAETEADLIWAKEKIAQNPDWIEYYEQLPHKDVLKLIGSCDVGLLPTWADSYGLSMLECQAHGCPVISTDIRALPEINNTECGWLIRVPKNDLGEALYSTPDERAKLSQQVQAGLEAIIRGIVADPSVIETKGNASIERIRKFHDPEEYAEKLRRIYTDAIR
ncbi:MAG: glycosyltransferase family 4 protein [Anaerolineaceae bacterium]|jgi:glycosyltransferase involved in cell wall biosynthesis